MPDEPDVVQPTLEDGQGEAGQESTAPYQEYLDRLPEDVRPQVEPVFREWDANTTRRFQESADRVRQWEPYEQLGVNQVPVEETEWLLQFRDAVGSNPEAVRQWYEQYAEQNNLYPESEQQQQQQIPGEAEAPYTDPFFTGDQQQLERLVQERVAPFEQQLSALEERWQQQDYAVREAQAAEYIEGQLTELAGKHPETFDRDLVESLVHQYVETDPANAVPRAFEDSQRIIAQIERQTLQGKTGAPMGAESGGTPASAPEEIKTLEEAGRIALQQLRANRGA